MIDSTRIKRAFHEICQLYDGFDFEPQVWMRDGHKRSPYRAFVVMGLSQRGSDRTNSTKWKEFLDNYPIPEKLIDVWNNNQEEVLEKAKGLGPEKRVRDVLQAIVKFGAAIPQNPNLLTRELGIGPKTADAVIAYGYGKPGLPLDSQVCRVVNRVNGSKPTCRTKKDYDPLRNELKSVFPEIDWIYVHEIFRLHGQAVCRPNPQCSICPLDSCLSRLPQQRFIGSNQRAREQAEAVMKWYRCWRELICNKQAPDRLKH